MGPSVLMILGFLLSPAVSSDMQDGDLITVQRNVTGILGEDVYLECVYTGHNVEDLLYSTWKRPESKKKLAGYFGQKLLTSEGFSAPASLSNLTVLRQVLSLDAEGKYTCEFATEEETLVAQLSLTILVRPDVTIQTMEETENDTHSQSVRCTASNAKPAPQISWEINGSAPSADIFSIQTESASHGNGTLTLSSVLRFPTHLNDESTVVCLVQHPALSEPRRMNASVQTFVAPTVTMGTGLVPESGDGVRRMLRVVNCTALGGRPQPKITWILPGEENTLVAREWSDDDNDDDEDTFISSVSFPAGAHEGANITCVVTHLKLPSAAKRTLTLPTYYLSSAELFYLNESSSAQRGAAVDQLHLEEGGPGVALALEVQGDVPSYQTECTKDGSSLPDGVELEGDELTLQGPVALHYAGHYECHASFYGHKASVQLDISVKPGIQAPSPVAPSIRVKTWRDLDSVIIECSALDAFPAPNISWSLPQGLTAETSLNVSSYNGSDSTTATVTLPACQPEEHRVLCHVEHLMFEDPESKEIVLPACARPSITVQSNVVWEQGSAYAELQCRVESVRPRANISWLMIDNNKTGGHGLDSVVELLGGEDKSEEEAIDVEGLNVTIRSALRLPLAEHQGKTVVCVVSHRSLLKPERKEIQLHAPDHPVIRTLLVFERSWPLMHAVCMYSGESGSANVTWLLHDNNTVTSAVLSSAHEGSKFKANASYEFPLARHEGSALTCLIHQEYGPVKRRVLRVPKYYISSLSVMNKTTCAPGDGVVVYRVALQEHVAHQKILLRGNGNVPYTKIFCSRIDNAAGLQMKETSALTSVMEFPMVASEREAGPYVCQASFHHLSATVYIQVEVTSHAAQHMALITICFSTALAITIFLIITLCVFCKRHAHPPEKKHSKKRESIATLTSLMHDPRSPELKKAAVPGVRGHHCAELVSIVLVQRTTV